MIIELSHPISPEIPVYPGDPKPVIKLNNSLSEDGFTDHSFTLGTHVGTHIDAPAHMIVGGKTLDQYPPLRFIGRAFLQSVTTPATLDSLQQLEINPGDTVVFQTGKSQHFHHPEYFDNTYPISEEVANYLVEKRVSMVGVDTWTVDSPPFPIHKILLGGDILIIENLTNLEQLPPAFTIIALPLNLPLDGSPCRVIASTEPIPAPRQKP